MGNKALNKDYDHFFYVALIYSLTKVKLKPLFSQVLGNIIFFYFLIFLS